jgi:hypothetical protein
VKIRFAHLSEGRCPSDSPAAALALSLRSFSGPVLRCAFAALIALVTLPAAASAQAAAPAAPTKAATAGTDDHGDYSVAVHLFDRVLNRGVTTTYQPGWDAGASYRVTHLISVVGEIGGDYTTEAGTSFHIYTFSGGARFQSGSRTARFNPFAQILMGTGLDNGSVGQSTPTNHFPVVTPGGGFDVRLAPHFAVRTKLDFPLYATFGDVHKGFRLGIGASIPVGTR